VGADRKGPLAAFLVVAVIAVILLVTSVRSQAAPGWIQGRLPASIVAAVPDAPAAGVWDSVGVSVSQAVVQGVVLVHRATQDPTTSAAGETTSGAPVTTAAVTSSTASSPSTAVSGGPPARPTSTHVARQGSHRAPAPYADPATGPTTSGHGRHLGQAHHHHGPGHGHGHAHEPHGNGPHGLHLSWTRWSS
jgi:hypothetical protein